MRRIPPTRFESTYYGSIVIYRADIVKLYDRLVEVFARSVKFTIDGEFHLDKPSELAHPDVPRRFDTCELEIQTNQSDGHRYGIFIAGSLSWCLPNEEAISTDVEILHHELLEFARRPATKAWGVFRFTIFMTVWWAGTMAILSAIRYVGKDNIAAVGFGAFAVLMFFPARWSVISRNDNIKSTWPKPIWLSWLSSCVSWLVVLILGGVIFWYVERTFLK